MKVATTDIYFCAYLMAEGIAIESMDIQRKGSRQKIIFIFCGNGKLARLNSAFQNGKALINPTEFKKSLLHLKDMMYDKLRDHTRERRDSYENNQERYREYQTVA